MFINIIFNSWRYYSNSSSELCFKTKNI